MKSYQLVDYGKPLKPVDIATPQPTGDEVLIEVLAAGVCHSDLHIWEGSYDLGGGKRLSLKDRGMQLPLTMGHENAGKIVAVGPDVKDRKVGEVCLVYPWIGCGECRVCRMGYENLCMKPRCIGVHCDGGYSDHLIIPKSKYLLPIGDLDPVAVAPYACSGVTTYSALKKLGDLIKEEPILVIGAGGLGLMCLSILKAMGGKGAIVVDIDRGAARGGHQGGRACGNRRCGAGRRRADHGRFRRPVLGRDRSGRKLRNGGAWLQCPGQGRQAGHGRPVWRRGALVAAPDTDEGGGHRRQLYRQSGRDARSCSTWCAKGRFRPFRSAAGR